MASCNLGAPNMKHPKLDFRRAIVGNVQQWSGIRAWLGMRQRHYIGVAISHKSKKSFNICCGPLLETEVAKGAELSDLTSQLIPNSYEVESLLTEICNTDSIAEFELKLCGFRLYVVRDVTEKSKLPFPPPASPSDHTLAPDRVNSSAEASDFNGSDPSTSLAISKPVPFPGGIQSFLEVAADEGLVILHSPTVGCFRRSRTIKGIVAPPSCEETQIVKEGQVLCFIEQLGGELPIKSNASGEVIKILREDGEPVAYGDALIAILPSFPGIKKLQ